MKKEQVKSFEDLECWKAAVEVRKFVTGLIKKLPATEKYELIDNMKRASRSAARNLTEGYGRFHYTENIQFCRHSRGSIYERIDDLITCKDENFLTVGEFNEGRAKIDKALPILNGYINYLTKAVTINSQERRLTINE